MAVVTCAVGYMSLNESKLYFILGIQISVDHGAGESKPYLITIFSHVHVMGVNCMAEFPIQQRARG